MKKKEPLFFLQDIKNSLDKILKYTSNISFDKLPQFKFEIENLVKDYSNSD